MRPGFPAFTAMLAVSSWSCSDGGAPNPAPTLEIVSGDGQRAGTGRALAAPLRVRVTSSDGQPIAGATVQWLVTQGQARLDPAQSSTDPSGDAETQVTSGSVVGPVTVSARAENLNPVTFSLTVLDPQAFISVSAGGGHTCGVTAAGDGYCWGANDYGKLGDGSDPTGSQSSPVLVQGGLEFAAVSAGGDHTCGITTAGAAYCWGREWTASPMPPLTRLVPEPVAGGVVFKSVSAGAEHTCGLNQAGDAYCWGPNGSGQLGDGTDILRTSPVPVAGGLRFTSVGASDGYGCGLATTGVAYCWGGNYAGQLGDGTRDAHVAPAQVPAGPSFTSIAVGAGHTCAVTAEGAAHCWGSNVVAQLGIGSATGPEICGTITYSCSTVPVPMAGGINFMSVGGGVTNGHSCGVATSGAAYCWGLNEVGQLGNGTTTGNELCQRQGPFLLPRPCNTVPVPVTGNLQFAAVSAGAGHTCGVTVAGRIYCWGSNREGQLGNGTENQSLTPVLVEN